MVDLTPPATCPAAFGASCYSYKVSWTEADPADVTIHVYAVTKCLAKPHCVLPTTTITPADLYSLGTAAATEGLAAASWSATASPTATAGCKSGAATLYLYAVVVQATSASGNSSYVIAWAW